MIKSFLLVFLTSFLFFNQLNGQKAKSILIAYNTRNTSEELKSSKESDNDRIYTKVEEMPRPSFGMTGFINYQNLNLRYPEEAIKNNIEGRVHIEFIVNKDGSLSNIKLLNHLGYGCDEEAVRLISSMPKWVPGLLEGKVVRVKVIQSIIFKRKSNLIP